MAEKCYTAQFTFVMEESEMENGFNGGVVSMVENGEIKHSHKMSADEFIAWLRYEHQKGMSEYYQDLYFKEESRQRKLYEERQEKIKNEK